MLGSASCHWEVSYHRRRSSFLKELVQVTQCSRTNVHPSSAPHICPSTAPLPPLAPKTAGLATRELSPCVTISATIVDLAWCGGYHSRDRAARACGSCWRLARDPGAAWPSSKGILAGNNSSLPAAVGLLWVRMAGFGGDGLKHLREHPALFLPRSADSVPSCDPVSSDLQGPGVGAHPPPQPIPQSPASSSYVLFPLFISPFLFLLPSPPSLFPSFFGTWPRLLLNFSFSCLPLSAGIPGMPTLPSLFVRVVHKDSPPPGEDPPGGFSHLHSLCAPSPLSPSITPPPGSLLCLPFATGMRSREVKTFTQGHTAEEIRMSRKKDLGKEGGSETP